MVTELRKETARRDVLCFNKYHQICHACVYIIFYISDISILSIIRKSFFTKNLLNLALKPKRKSVQNFFF